MSEEPKKQEENTSQPNSGNQQPANDPLIEFRAERERMEKAAENLKRENDRLERLRGADILGGRTAANTTAEKKEETPKEYMKKVMSGKI